MLKADVVTVIETGLKEKEEKLGRLLGGDEEEDDNSGVAAPSAAAAGSGGVSGAVAAAVSAKGQGDGDAMDTFATGPGDGLGGGGGGAGAGARPTPRTGAGQSGKGNGVSKVDKRAIEQRIEEDRERNKRLRESVWAVSGDDEQELDKMWEERPSSAATSTSLQMRRLMRGDSLSGTVRLCWVDDDKIKLIQAHLSNIRERKRAFWSLTPNGFSTRALRGEELLKHYWNAVCTQNTQLWFFTPSRVTAGTSIATAVQSRGIVLTLSPAGRRGRQTLCLLDPALASSDSSSSDSYHLPLTDRRRLSIAVAFLLLTPPQSICEQETFIFVFLSPSTILNLWDSIFKCDLLK